MREAEIVIVGGGPAGLAAALEGAAVGAEVVLIDEYPTLGGQYYKQMGEGFIIEDETAMGGAYAEGTTLIERVRNSRVEVILGGLVWGIFDGHTLCVYREGRTERFRAQQLILAPGAQEVPVAFPGWTLPGVMTGGAAQTLLVSQGIVPGEHVVLAGVGPLQLKVASQFVEAGSEVAAVVEASTEPPTSVGNALRAFGHWGKMREGLQYWLKLKKAGVPYHTQQVPIRAMGSGELEAVVVAEVDAKWRVVPGTERTIEADTLCLSYGFLPATQLPRLAGCRMQYDADSGGWVTEHGVNQETSVAGVYVAGEVAGIGGADVAEEEGRLAAFGALRALKRIPANGVGKREAKSRARLAEAQEFAQLTRDMMRLQPGLFELITNDTIICRCEEIPTEVIRAAIAEGELTPRGVKIRTRAGMGCCQGRTCGYLIAQLIAQQTGTPLNQIELDTPRPPVKPVPLAAL